MDDERDPDEMARPDDAFRPGPGEEISEDVLVEDELAEGDDGLTGDERYEGYLEAGVDPTGVDRLGLGSPEELRGGETIDPYLAAEEGLTYVPPTDPVVVPDPDDPEGIQIAAGLGASTDEPFDADHHSELLPTEDEMTDRVREALRADAATTRYAEDLLIDTEAGVVTVRGEVDDVLDSDEIVAVAADVSGIVEVRDRLTVRGL
ncbi:MAG: BON domain-containing protein [Chloroflexota bacterium]